MNQHLAKMCVYIEAGWCQGHEALSEVGKPTSPTFGLVGEPAPSVKSIRAAKWSLYGAYRAVTLNAAYDDKLALRSALSKAIKVPANAETMQQWNDAKGHTQSSVLTALKEAS